MDRLKLLGRLVIVAAVGVVLFFLSFGMYEGLDADKIMVVQSPLSGDLTWHNSAGVKWQGWGKITKYPKRSIYQFEIPVRFNDGGHATMHGSIQYEMPLDAVNLTALHTRFGSPEAIQRQLLETVTNKSVYMTGPLMTSKESYAEKRNYLIYYVEDQIANGVYKTTQKEVRVKDAMTGADKTVAVVEIAMGPNGTPERQEEAVLRSFGIKPFAFSIEKLPYDREVEEQISKQQSIAMDVQTAIADAKKAEQRAITVAKQGEAEAASAKWEQEVIKARAVTEAQQQLEVARLEAQRKLEVARLDAQAAAEFKRAEQLRGEGEGARRRAVMQADGALEKRLDAWVRINERYAEAIEKYPGSWVPQIVMGGGNAQPGSGAQALVDMLTIKTAQELGLGKGAGIAGK